MTIDNRVAIMREKEEVRRMKEDLHLVLLAPGGFSAVNTDNTIKAFEAGDDDFWWGVGAAPVLLAADVLQGVAYDKGAKGLVRGVRGPAAPANQAALATKVLNGVDAPVAPGVKFAPGGKQFTAAEAEAALGGKDFIGVLEVGPSGVRTTAGRYSKQTPRHKDLSDQNLGKIEGTERRLGFTRDGNGNVTIGPSSTGSTPTIQEIPQIRAALAERGFVTNDGLHIIVAEDAATGRIGSFNLMTGELIKWR